MELNLAVVIVTHDLGVARLLANRLLVMKQGRWWRVTDRVLDDPHHPYTQLLVSSVLQNCFAGWRLRLTRPTGALFVGRVSEAPPGNSTRELT